MVTIHSAPVVVDREDEWVDLEEDQVSYTVTGKVLSYHFNSLAPGRFQ